MPVGIHYIDICSKAPRVWQMQRMDMNRPSISLLFLLTAFILLVIAQEDPPVSQNHDFALFPLWERISTPVGIRFAPNGEIFIPSRSGLIYYAHDLKEKNPVKVADLTKEVFNNFDRGLTGLAVHPEWPLKPYVFVLYGRDAEIGMESPKWNDLCPTGFCLGSNALARLTWNADEKQLEDLNIIINDWCITTTTHQVGDLHFDQLGNLVLSSGDMTLFDNGLNFGEPPNPCPYAVKGDPESGGAMQSQSLGNPVGKLVFVSKADLESWLANNADKPKLRPHAIGFRNPYRFSIDPLTNEIYLGDVGFADIEELNHIDAIIGDDTPPDKIKNYGWPCKEGPLVTEPVRNRNFVKCTEIYNGRVKAESALFYYDHTNMFGDIPLVREPGGQSAITGVAVYRGDVLPNSYDGSVWFLDYTRRACWVICRKDGKLDVDNIKMMFSGVQEGVDLTFGPDGALYITQVWTGMIWKYMYVKDRGVPPIARVKPNKTYGPLPLTVNFDASASVDPLRGNIKFEWSFDGSETNYHDLGPLPQYTFLNKVEGGQIVKLRLTSDKPGAGSSVSEVPIYPGYSISADINLSQGDYTFAVGDSVSFSMNAKTESGLSVSKDLTQWVMLIAHCYPGPECRPDAKACHSHMVNTFDGSMGETIQAPDHEYPSWLTLGLDVVHPEVPDLRIGFIRQMVPRSVTIILDTNPPNLHLLWNLWECRAPCPYTGLQKGTMTLDVSKEQMDNFRQAYRFTRWTFASGYATVQGNKPDTETHRVLGLERNDTRIVANFEKYDIPVAPTNLAVTVPTEIVVSPGWRACTVSWKPPTASLVQVGNSQDITNFIIYYRESKFMDPTTSVDGFKTHMVDHTAQSWELKKVDVGSKCEFRVSGVTKDGEGQVSKARHFYSMIVPPSDIFDCPEKVCTYKGALLDDWECDDQHKAQTKNLLNMLQESDESYTAAFGVRNGKLVVRPKKNKLKDFYWYSLITDPAVRCFDAYKYYTHLVFRTNAPAGADFGISLHSKSSGCREYLPKKRVMVSQYATMDGTEKLIQIPLQEISLNPRAIVSVAFDRFKTGDEVLFDDLGFINLCEYRPSLAKQHGVFTDPKSLIATGAALAIAVFAYYLF